MQPRWLHPGSRRLPRPERAGPRLDRDRARPPLLPANRPPRPGPPPSQNIANLSRAAAPWGIASVVRIHPNDPGLIGRILDCGASGIVAPHVSTKEEALRVVKGGKFSPVGMRGMYGGRRAFGRKGDLYAQAKDEVCLVVLIEEKAALDNLDEILTVDGIDVFQVAPSTLPQT